MIEIKNFRVEKQKELWDFRVDRKTPLGNPFDMGHDESKRNVVCDAYLENFSDIVSNAKAKEYLDSLVRAYKQYGRLNLFCWCAPKRCHAETIRDYISSCVGEM